ncbi:hypothetical protein K438DRAFT_1787457 [Mycena galopus ATCC 62051]|nr:hypothetical protein K438DRAFT_1787457 [Mycena galopus ATCC 62051]
MLALCFCLKSGSNHRTAVTLWQFGGVYRLLPGQTLLPMEPIGTAGNGVATTCLYQALNPTTVLTSDTDGFSEKTILAPTSRTIVVAASGWVEPQATFTISCGFVDSTFGQCFNLDSTMTVLSNSGTPSPVVIPVSQILNEISVSSVPMSFTATSGPTFSGLSSTSSASIPTPSDDSSPTPPTKTPAVGAIVGGVIGTMLLIIGALLALWWCRRRKIRHITEDANISQPRPYNTQLNAPMRQVELSSTELSSKSLVLIRGTRSHKNGQTSGVANIGPSNVPCDIPTSELAWALYHRMQHQDFTGAPSPPHYT